MGLHGQVVLHQGGFDLHGQVVLLQGGSDMYINYMEA